MLAEAKPTWSEPIMQMDMGWQYQHAEFVAALKGMGVVQSMSRKGNCLDNACTEGMFGHLKDEFLHGRDWDTFEAFKADLEGYIHHWNHVRRQVKLKGLTPVEFREQALREAAPSGYDLSRPSFGAQFRRGGGTPKRIRPARRRGKNGKKGDKPADSRGGRARVVECGVHQAVARPGNVAQTHQGWPCRCSPHAPRAKPARSTISQHPAPVWATRTSRRHPSRLRGVLAPQALPPARNPRRRRIWQRRDLPRRAPPAPRGHQAHAARLAVQPHVHRDHRDRACGGAHGEHAATPQHRAGHRLHLRRRIRLPRHGVR